LHIAHEEGLISNSSIHAGIRAPVANRKYDMKHDRACGFHNLKARDLDKLGMAGFIEKLKERVEGTKVYISVDIDVLDPAYVSIDRSSLRITSKSMHADEIVY
jgi:agmatinase